MTTTTAGRFVQVMLVLNGVNYVAAGLLLLLAPEWFYTHVGTFPPFNRHYEGDLGGFLLALGAGLLCALRYPTATPGVLGVAAAGGTLHALNHVVDALQSTGGWDQALGLLVLGALTVAAFVYGAPAKRGSATPMSADPRAQRLA